MMRETRNALAFCSRLVPPAPSESGGTDIAAAVPFFPLAGALLGLLAALPAHYVPSCGAWLYPLVLAWLTRGLHWDGLADLADACGSNATGDRFWEILKDSRIGAFGVMALVFGITGQMAAARECILNGNLSVLILAPAYGRSMVIVLGRATRTHPASSLAALVQSGTRSGFSPPMLALTVAATFFALGPKAFCLAMAITAVCIWVIIRIASRNGGANGDFYGTAIIAAEICLLAAGAV